MINLYYSKEAACWNCSINGREGKTFDTLKEVKIYLECKVDALNNEVQTALNCAHHAEVLAERIELDEQK